MRIAAIAALAVLLPAAAALADEMPTRKAGLWESKISSADMPVVTAKQCIDAETDRKAMGAVGGASDCAKKTFTKTADGYDTEAECKIGGMTVKGHGKITGDFETALHMEQTTDLSGIPGIPDDQKSRVITIDAKRLGDCEAGQKPGDMIMPDGKVVRTPGSGN